MSGQIEHNPVVRRFIEDIGNLTQSLGVGRVLGQIYAYLYFSQEPRNLYDLQNALAISKGSASTGVRQLEQWGAVKKVWVKGDRKDYYEASDWFGRILKNVLTDIVGKKLVSYESFLDESEDELAKQTNLNGDREFITQRISQMKAFQKKTQTVWKSPILKGILK